MYEVNEPMTILIMSVHTCTWTSIVMYMYMHVPTCTCVPYRELVWELLIKSDCSEPLLTEARKIISHNSEALYRDVTDHADFITYLLNVGESTDSEQNLGGRQ